MMRWVAVCCSVAVCCGGLQNKTSTVVSAEFIKAAPRSFLEPACCSVLQCVAVGRSVLQYVAALQCVAVCCSVFSVL